MNLDEVRNEALITVSETDFKNFLKHIHNQCNAHVVRIEERLKKVAVESGKDANNYLPLIEFKQMLASLPSTAAPVVSPASSSNLKKK
jgi:hypothetical protein